MNTRIEIGLPFAPCEIKSQEIEKITGIRYACGNTCRLLFTKDNIDLSKQRIEHGDFMEVHDLQADHNAIININSIVDIRPYQAYVVDAINRGNNNIGIVATEAKYTYVFDTSDELVLVNRYTFLENDKPLCKWVKYKI